MRFAFIEVEKVSYPLSILCRVMEVTKGGFHVWRTRPLSAKKTRDIRLKAQVRAIFEEHKKRYGSPRVFRQLQKAGACTSEKRVARIMREESLVAQRVKRFKITTDSAHGKAVSKNVLARDFEADAPNQKWVGDITYLRCIGGWLYLAVIIDLFSRKVVGFAFRKTMEAELPAEALEMGFILRGNPKGVLHHSDRGSQYVSELYKELLEEALATCSMSRKGNCWDNAVAESFFSTLKFEVLTDVDLDGHSTARQLICAIADYIRYYNNQRMHSTLDYRSPVEFELMNRKTTALKKRVQR